jgi:hypothetical protein
VTAELVVVESHGFAQGYSIARLKTFTESAHIFRTSGHVFFFAQVTFFIVGDKTVKRVSGICFYCDRYCSGIAGALGAFPSKMAAKAIGV